MPHVGERAYLDERTGLAQCLELLHREQSVLFAPEHEHRYRNLAQPRQKIGGLDGPQ